MCGKNRRLFFEKKGGGLWGGLKDEVACGGDKAK